MQPFAFAPTAFLFFTLGVPPVIAEPWRLTHEESFDQKGWQENWIFSREAGPLDQGALRSPGRELRAKLKKVIKAPAIRVEFEAQMLAKDEAGMVSDLSVFVGPLFFQFGGEHNTTTTIRGRPLVSALDSEEPPKITVGKKHKVVAAVDGLYCRLTVDGQLASEALLRKPLSDAQVALYSWTGPARFDNLKIHSRSIAGQVPAEFMLRLEERKLELDEEETRREVPKAFLGELRVVPTIHSIGIEWELDGDGNHNATCTAHYRKEGAEEWKEALGPLRIDYRGWYDTKRRQAYRHFNRFAGSIMFLDGGTAYEIKLKASDPDGGEAEKLVKVITRLEPGEVKGDRILHVVPDDEAGDAAPGDGSEKSPFRGLPAAEAAARPGDVFLLHAGEYLGTTLKKSGKPEKPIVWKAAGDGEALLRSHIAFSASHLRFEGLIFEPKEEQDFGGLRGNGQGHHDIVVVRNTFRNCRYAVSNTELIWDGDPEALNRRWVISDNEAPGGEWTEYFTRLYLLADSDICYNRLSTTLNGKGGDGISVRYSKNTDLYHNDLRDIDDDLFEPDASFGNIRIWRNRGMNAKIQAVSMQPMMGSPWYIIQNEFVMLHPDRRGTIFKTNVFDRTVQVNNTFVTRGRYGERRADLLLKSFSRNNLWIHLYDNPYEETNPGGALWHNPGDRKKDERYSIHGQTRADWRSEADYDGFDWGSLPKPFWWAHHRCPGLEMFRKVSGIEAHALRVRKEELFEVTDLKAYAAETYSPRRLTLREGCNAIDAGQSVPNLAEDFEGQAPDLGAHELGRPPWNYGPRK